MKLKNLQKNNVKNYTVFKSQAKIADTVAIIVILAIVVIFASIMLGKIFKTLESILTSTNPKLLSIELSSLMTISGSAPNEIEIIYKLPEYTINVSSKDKVLTVENRLLEKYTDSRYNSTFATNFNDFDFKNVNILIIKKTMKDGEAAYEFRAKKE